MSTSRHPTGVILSHAGRQHAYHVATALQSAGVLELFFTSSYYKRDLFPDQLARLVPPLDRWLGKRSEPLLDSRRVRRFPWLEVPELAHRFVRGPGGEAGRLVEKRDVSFDLAVSRLLEKLSARVFWGFQGSCLASLRAAREAGMGSIIELASIPSQVSQMLLNQDRMGRSATAEAGGSDEFRERLEKEPAAADYCIAASTFTARSLESIGILPDKIQVIPLGVDVRRFRFEERKPAGPLRALFVGKLGRHKGLAYLRDAMRRLAKGRVRLTLVGPSVGDDDLRESWKEGVEIVGPLGGEDLLRMYASHDVLVLPSLYEGFGLVILEAMASGMPVIATANSCAPDVVREGIDGFVVPAFDSDAIAVRMEWFADNARSIPEMGRNASARALDFSWEQHARRVGAFAASMLDKSAEGRDR